MWFLVLGRNVKIISDIFNYIKHQNSYFSTNCQMTNTIGNNKKKSNCYCKVTEGKWRQS